MEANKEIMNTENNKIIAEFMGMKPINKNESNGIWNCTIKAHGFNIVQHLSFHSDWNWLMEVVEKIESLNVVVEIRENVCYIETSQNDYTSELELTKIQATYKACIEFIKRYNQNAAKEN